MWNVFGRRETHKVFFFGGEKLKATDILEGTGVGITIILKMDVKIRMIRILGGNREINFSWSRY